MKLIKKVIFSFFFIYAFDIFTAKYGIIVPINMFTLLIVYIFDIPGMFLLVMLLKIT